VFHNQHCGVSRPKAVLGVALAAVILLTVHPVASAPGEPFGLTASCDMTNVTSTASWTFQAGFVSGEGLYTFFNPAEGCGAPVYPYEITTFQFMLGGSTSQVNVDIVVYGMAVSGDSCGGPGVELYRKTVPVQGNNSTPQLYTFLPGELCVDGPFFMGLAFHHSGLPGPGRQATSPPLASRCENYIWSGGSYYDAIAFSMVYYPAFWVSGQTGQCRVPGACCDPYGGCSISTRAECEALGRTYMGDNTDCDPNPCSPAFGCIMTNTTGDNSWVFQQGFVIGEGLYTFYNPEVDCGSQAYPFELGGFRFMFGGSTSTKDVDVVVYDVAPSGDSCDGPGTELFRFTTSATGNNSVPNAFEFPSGQCCVNGPFFIGLEFHHSGLPGPGRETDSPTAATCENWILSQPGSVFYDAVNFGVTRYPGYWVYGEPRSSCRLPGACCDQYNFCTVTTQGECEAKGSSYSGDDTTCDPNPCGPGGNCALTNVTPTSSWTFLAGFVSGEGLYTFFNPEEDCSTPAYPYEIAAFQFMLGGSTNQVSLDIVAYDAAVSGDSCDGPGVELYRKTIQVQGANGSPQECTFLPGELCVNSPFFMGLEFKHNSLPGPARQADSPPLANRCENYIWSGGSYYDAIAFGMAYYPAFWIYGQTEQCQATCCTGRVGDANGVGTYPHEVTISDIQMLVTAKFISSLPCEQNLHCLTEADVNQSGGAHPTCNDITISDIQTLVNHLFIAGPLNAPLKDCL
jgi:hypothetical protein